jgi:hypothetical protein
MAKKKPHEKMLTILGHKGNANKNHTKVPSDPCYNGCPQENHQQ